MLPGYVWIAVFVGRYHDKLWHDYMAEIIILCPLAVLGFIALIQLLGLWFRSTPAHATFRLAVVNAKGEPADRTRLLIRWAIVWLPLFVPMLCVAPLIRPAELSSALICGAVWLALWISAAVYAVIHTHRGLHDRLARTWVVRR
jgi:uncharacterized RDD family membrane protein YckC